MSEAGRDLAVVIFILIALGALWVTTGGPEKGSFQNPFVMPPIPVQEADFGVLDAVPGVGGQPTTGQPVGGAGATGLPSQGGAGTVELPKAKKDVKLVASKWIAAESDPDKEYIELQAPTGNTEPVLITATEKDGEIEIEGERVRTRTNFPLSIGENNQLMITKKDGTTKEVAILPDAAVKNLEQKGFVPTLEAELTVDESTKEAVYDVDVKEEKRFLGLFKVTFDKRARISAKTGEVSDESSPRLPFWQRFLDRFSF